MTVGQQTESEHHRESQSRTGVCNSPTEPLLADAEAQRVEAEIAGHGAIQVRRGGAARAPQGPAQEGQRKSNEAGVKTGKIASPHSPRWRQEG